MKQREPGGVEAEKKRGGGLDLRNVHRAYRMDGVEVSALQEVTLHVDPGEYVAIMGPSGSGKSTMMNLAGCLDRPTSGCVLIDGENTERMKERELARMRNRCVGFVFQSFNLLSRTTALANVEVPLLYGGVARAERHRRAREALESVGLGHRIEHHPSQLSGGEQQRVAIARALVHHPRIILADEPTGNLDSATAHEIMELVKKLHGSGQTIVMVTHEADISAYAGRIITLKDGKIINDTANP